MAIRRAAPAEVPAIKECVRVSLNATYGGLWTEEPLIVDDDDWGSAWIACPGAEIIGVGLSERDVVSDLWVRPGYQGQGAGSALLAALEAEIAARGFTVARLRCLEPNLRSRAFYAAKGWKEVRVYPHERIPLNTVDMEKRIAHGR
jgi:GNAT superfamily N-acetyltransferase